MSYRLLLPGDRPTFTILALDVAKRNCAFSPTIQPIQCLLGRASCLARECRPSRRALSGLLYTFEIDHAQKACRTTSQQQTQGAPAHYYGTSSNAGLERLLLVVMLRARSTIALATTKTPAGLCSEMMLARKSCRISPTPSRATAPTKTASDNAMSTKCWRTVKVGCKLQTWDQTAFGSSLGARTRPSLNLKYALGFSVRLEQAPGMPYSPLMLMLRIHYICPRRAFPHHPRLRPVCCTCRLLPAAAPLSISPIQGFAPNIIPTIVPPTHQLRIDSAEICLHPTISNVIYASNRWERHIAQREPQIQDTRILTVLPAGDAIAILLLSDNGRAVVEIRHVRTNLDVICGMRLSNDGRYVVLAGQEGGGVEVYDISGEGDEVWTLAAGLNEGLDAGLKHAVWL
ncbi:predicted protein [Aspergillus nidulans FGSC A4]|uniref:Uncharacterized protein n=1 Tax=Emericella nidulans (strain FGSC A4 / ATCC 38163 / CBS 112.46 / NRRL 194 / M139) TaxID=227321 RepID=Q5B033_EMENI|nr:hypothetical protein [Aspergillus nidulans FGSC A4]EAA58072.1 predicted protein [Aspergillus nidulans FGSC A4]CBF70190.1 TPA: conserved hypothetical protein [Aspergillus nidulans FGSC A4]|eukprot:XP_663701.1 predicted protein [Aspergillus nidulans FGSC A4]